MQQPELRRARVALKLILNLIILRVVQLAEHRQMQLVRAEIPSAMSAAFVDAHLEIRQQGKRLVCAQHRLRLEDLNFELVLKAACRHVGRRL